MVYTPPPPPAPAASSVPPTPWAQTQAGMDYAHEQRKEQIEIERRNRRRQLRVEQRGRVALAKRQQRHALALQADEQKFLANQAKRQRLEQRRIRAKELARVKQENINSLRMERHETFAQMMEEGDQVRAVMFAAGYGPENDAFDVRARQLGVTTEQLKGTKGLRRTTQKALSRVLDRRVRIGKKGVRGLGTAVGSAKALVQGGADVQQLLTSAFGVGSLKAGERPGMSQARLYELAESVVPTGVL